MPVVYEERKEQFRKRIRAVIDYAENDRICRSRQLLRYFGEKDSHDCGQCDVCLEHRPEGMVSETGLVTAQNAILQLLIDKKPHPIMELHGIQLSTDELNAALKYLLKEEIIRMEDGMIYRCC